MKPFYAFFFIRQIIVLMLFLSNLDPTFKIYTMLFIDEFGGNLPFYDTKNALNLSDRVIIMDTIGSMFCYFQILVLVIENNLIKTNLLYILLGVLFIHILSILNYLKNSASSKHDKYIFPDLFKLALVGCFFLQNKLNGPSVHLKI